MTTPQQPHRYTHGYTAAVLGGHRRRTAANSAAHLLPHLQTGQRLLDIGSGAGTITADLARAVAPAPVVAVEVTEEAAALTRTELENHGITDAEVIVADAHHLPLPDDSFDVVHAHQVLQHVADPVAMLREMRRVTHPGGIIAVRDADYPAFCWYPAVPQLDRWRELYVQAATSNGGSPDAGRRLLAWARAAGLEDVQAGASTWCYADEDSRRWWAESWAGRTTGPALGEQLIREGRAAREELEQIAAAWHEWAVDPDAWFMVPHGEILARA